MKKLLLLLSLACIGHANAQPYVLIPDINFANYLQVLIPAAMNGDSLNTTSPLVTTSTHTLNLNSRSIVDLTGVQYFTSLSDLICYTNSVTTLPALPNSLTYFDCRFNSLTALPPLPNSLTFIDCSNNSLTALPALPTSLIHLGCANNLLTTLPTLPNSIQFLTCVYNSITSLPALPTALIQFYCNGNSLTTLPALPTSIQNVYCPNNNITCFPPFPNSIINLSIDPNPYNCLPNHILAMSSTDLAVPICTAGNSNGCAVTGVQQITLNNVEINIFPNPTSDQFFIETNATDKLNADLYDVNGRHVFSKSVSDKSNINVTTLENGIYTMTIKTADNIINKKLVIVH